jgi:uncharacterized phage protein (TIGR02218 family)
VPRTCPTTLLNVLNSQVPTLAIIIKVTRVDGQVFGFTSTDIDITIGGVLYERQSAISPSALRSTVGTGVDNLDFSGLLNSNKITDADVLAGIWDNADIDMMLCDYTNPAGGTMDVLAGKMGEIIIQDGEYTCEFRSLSQRLQQEIIDLTQATCRAPQFGDPLTCASGGLIGVHALSFYQRTGQTVHTQNGTGTGFTVADTGDGTDYFDYGKATFTSGLNKGIAREIKTSPLSGGYYTFNMAEAFPFAIAPGDTLTLEAGCDRNFSTCVDKFGNNLNFRGEPFVPGNDTLIKHGHH